METTRLSTKGQIILPKSIRVAPAARLDEVAGCLRTSRKSKTPAQMATAIDQEVLRRHDRGRY